MIAHVKVAVTESTSSHGNSTWELSDDRADKSGTDRFSHGSQWMASAEPAAASYDDVVGVQQGPAP
jgi:hypothetical protein